MGGLGGVPGCGVEAFLGDVNSLWIRYGGLFLRLRWPRVWFWVRRWTSSGRLLAIWMTWSGSVACAVWGVAAL